MSVTGKPEKADSLEQAIGLCRANTREYCCEWYSLSKTNADLNQYIKDKGIDTKALGVFLGGNPENDPGAKIVVIPRHWMAVDGRQPGYLQA